MLSPAGKFDAAKRATIAAIDELVDGTYFTIVAGTELGRTGLFRRTDRRQQANAATKAAAARAVDGLRPNGGTAMGTWLAHVRGSRRPSPGSADPRDPAHRRQGRARNPRTTADSEIALSEGKFTCDCRGVGTGWRVEELRVRSRRRCWAPWTSSPIPRISPKISPR